MREGGRGRERRDRDRERERGEKKERERRVAKKIDENLNLELFQEGTKNSKK